MPSEIGPNPSKISNVRQYGAYVRRFRSSKISLFTIVRPGRRVGMGQWWPRLDACDWVGVAATRVGVGQWQPCRGIFGGGGERERCDTLRNGHGTNAHRFVYRDY